MAGLMRLADAVTLAHYHPVTVSQNQPPFMGRHSLPGKCPCFPNLKELALYYWWEESDVHSWSAK